MLTCLISTINSLHYNIAHNKKWHIQTMENPISSEVVKPHTLVQATANDMQACFGPQVGCARCLKQEGLLCQAASWPTATSVNPSVTDTALCTDQNY